MRKMNIRRVINHGHERWVVDWRSAGVRRQRYFEREREARAFGAEVKRGAIAFSLFDRYSDAAKQEMVSAIQRADAGGYRLADALSYYEQHGLQSNVRPVEIGAAVEACIASKQDAGLRLRSIQSLRSTLTRFAASHIGRELASITPEDVRTWLSSGGWSPRTRRGYLTDITTFFSWAIRTGLLLRSPAAGIDPPREDVRKPQVLTVEQARALVDAAVKTDSGLIPYVAIGLFAGVRPAEIAALTWADVDLEHGQIHVSGTVAKTRRWRLVDIRPNLRDWLELGGDLPVRNLAKRWRRLLQAAGITDWPHDAMRHSAASYMLAADQDAARVALQLGHSQDVLMRVYRELVRPADAAAYWAIVPNKKAAP